MDKNERLGLLEEILAIDSTNGNEKEVAQCLAVHLKKSGIASKLVDYSPDRSGLFAEIGTGGSVFGLSGHMDVVAPGDLSLWTSPPFSPTIRDGKLFARGATDMKSGLAAMVVAMKELADEGTNLPGRVRLLATVGEEVGLLGADQMTKEGYADEVEALIIGEPTGRRIAYAHKGVFSYTVTSLGKGAHSSMPELGVNAIDQLLVFYNEMMAEFAKLTAENPALGKLVYCNSIINGGQQINMVPDKASLSANVRTTPEVSNAVVKAVLEGVIDRLNQTVPAMNLTLEIHQSDSPMFSDINSKLVQIAREEAEKTFGQAVPVLGAPGGTDAAKFVEANKNMQVIIFGPGNDTLHKIDEYVDVEDYLGMIDLYKTIIKRYFA